MLPPYIFCGYRRYLDNLREHMYIAYCVLRDYRRYRTKRRIGMGLALAGAALIAWERVLAVNAAAHPTLVMLLAGSLLFLSGLACFLFCNAILRAIKRGYPRLKEHAHTQYLSQ